MNATLSEDSLAILLLCSNLVNSIKTENAIKPLTLGEWNKISYKLMESPMERPKTFFRSTPNEWQKYLDLSDEQTLRIQKLLSRGGQLGIELDRLKSLGIWITTRTEESYPIRLKKILGRKCPIILYGAGDQSLLNSDGVAIVGSRDVDEDGALFAQRLSRRCAIEGLTIVSGGSRGVDLIAQNAAIHAGGRVIAVLSDGLENSIRQKEQRESILSKKLVLLSAYNPKARFTVFTAKERNKHIYALSKYAVVVASALNKGGSWAGATENLKSRWVPMFVADGPYIPIGNKRLLELGGVPLSLEIINNKEIKIQSWLNNLVKDKWENQILKDEHKTEKTTESINLQLDFEFEKNYQDKKSKGISSKPLIGIDLFTVVWPYIEKALSTPQNERDLANAFKVTTKQIQDWLERAVNIGKVLKLTNTNQYVLATKPSENALDNIP